MSNSFQKSKFNTALRAAAQAIAYLDGGASRVEVGLLRSSEWSECVRPRQGIRGALNLDVIECAGFVAEHFVDDHKVSATGIHGAIQKNCKGSCDQKYLLFAAETCKVTHVELALSLVKRHWFTIFGVVHHLLLKAEETTYVCQLEKRNPNIFCLAGKSNGNAA
jgi:hypothetical protein